MKVLDLLKLRTAGPETDLFPANGDSNKDGTEDGYFLPTSVKYS